MCDCLDTLFIISNNYDGGLSRIMNEKSHLLFRLALYQVSLYEMKASHERVFKINKVIF